MHFNQVQHAWIGCAARPHLRENRTKSPLIHQKAATPVNDRNAIVRSIATAKVVF